MSDEGLKFLDETQDEAPAEQPEPEAAKPEQEAPAPEVVDEDAEPSTGEDEVAPPAAEDEDKRSIPVTALLDEREKRQKAERELEQMRAWRAQQEQAARQQQQPKPDFYDNPEAAISQHVTKVKLDQSRFLAEREFGADVVKEAVEFFNDPQHQAASHQMLNHPSPFHAAVDYVKRQRFLAEVGTDPDKWREAERERIRQEIMAQSQPSKAQAAPPPSMARAPSAGRQAIAPGSAFDQMLGDT